MYYRLIHRDHKLGIQWTFSINGNLVRIRKAVEGSGEDLDLETGDWEQAPEPLTGKAYALQVLSEIIDELMLSLLKDDPPNDPLITFELRVTDDADEESRTVMYTILEDRTNFVELINDHVWHTEVITRQDDVRYVKERIMKWVQNEMLKWG